MTDGIMEENIINITKCWRDNGFMWKRSMMKYRETINTKYGFKDIFVA